MMIKKPETRALLRAFASHQFLLSLILSFVSLVPAAASAADTLDQTVNIDIAANTRIEDALIEWGLASHMTVMFNTTAATGIIRHEVRGNMSARQALAMLLSGSKLTFTRDGQRIRIIPSAGLVPTSLSNLESSSAPVTASDSESGSPDNSSGSASESDENSEPGRHVGSNLEQVVVTATHRAEKLQDIPMSLTALSADEVEQRDITGMGDYLTSVPGVSHLDEGVGRNSTVIRGITLDPEYEGSGSGQTVGYYFGEVPLSDVRWNSPDLKLVDMDRVELLRGPQGTLYGAGSLAGTLRNIPVAPHLGQFDGYAKVDYSNTARFGGSNSAEQAAVNLPLVSDAFAVRIVGYHFQDSGYIHNVAGSDPTYVANATAYGASQLAENQDGVGADRYVGGRIEALWHPLEALDINFSYITQDASQLGLPESDLGLPLYTQARLQVNSESSEGLSDHSRIANVLATYGSAWGQFVLSSSYMRQTYERGYGLDTFFGGVPIPQIFGTTTDGVSEELRFVSNQFGPWQYIAGYFFEHLIETSTGTDYYSGSPALSPYSSPTSEIYAFTDKTWLRQNAVFGELSYSIIPQLTLTAGSRRSDYNKADGGANSVAFGGGGPEVENATLNTSQVKTTWKASISYKPTEEAMLYALWSQGFRLGSPLSPIINPACNDGTGHVVGYSDYPLNGASLKSDSLTNYELGAKFQLLQKRLNLNAALYEIDWVNLPITVFVPSPCAASLSLNAGKARSRGIEVESDLLLVQGLKFDLSGSFNKAVLNGDSPGIGTDGQRLPGSPQYQFATGLQYGFNVGQLPTYVRGDYMRVGSYFNDVAQTAPREGDYGRFDARIGLTVSQFDIGVYGKNLTNAAEITWADSAFPGRAERLRPRTIGADFKYSFH